MTTLSPPAARTVARRIADLLDENAECYSENAMDRAFLGNSEELAALVVGYLALSAAPSPEALPASGAEAGGEVVSAEEHRQRGIRLIGMTEHAGAHLCRAEKAEEERDALLGALGFKPGPFKDELTRKVILDDAAGMRPAMVKTRREASRVQGDADLWTMRMLEEWPGDTLLLRLWRQKKEAERRLEATLAKPASEPVGGGSDRRPDGWTEAMAVTFIAENGANPEIGMFAKSFTEGAWGEIADEWPEFVQFVSRRAALSSPASSSPAEETVADLEPIPGHGYSIPAKTLADELRHGMQLAGVKPPEAEALPAGVEAVAIDALSAIAVDEVSCLLPMSDSAIRGWAYAAARIAADALEALTSAPAPEDRTDG